jgi:hypothetical protein
MKHSSAGCGLMDQKGSPAGHFMSLSRCIAFVFSLVFGLGIGRAAGTSAAQPSSASDKPSPILPAQFGGWQMQGTASTSTEAASADPTNAAVLREYRFTDFASATYTRDDGRTLKIRAARFADASGAFGAYTFYLQPEMTRMQIDDQGASLGQRVLFYRGQVLVDALFSQESSMSGAQLRELAGALPRASGSSGNLPTFIQFMPSGGYIANTQKYAMGPTALAAVASPVNADLVDFGLSSEVSMGRYNTSSGEATLMLISYPTPQLAADHLRRINATHQLPPPQPGELAIMCAGDFCDKRSGPIVAVVTGPASESDAKSLLAMVNYEAKVTWNQATDQHQVKDLYMLILNVVILCAILGGLAIVAGVAFGGFRILMKRWFPDKIFDRPEHMEFIALHLAETAAPPSSQTGNQGGRPEPQNPS